MVNNYVFLYTKTGQKNIQFNSTLSNRMVNQDNRETLGQTVNQDNRETLGHTVGEK